MKNIFSVCYLNKKQRQVSGLLLCLFSFQNVSFAATGIREFNHDKKSISVTKVIVNTSVQEPTKSETKKLASGTIDQPKRKCHF